MTMAQDSGKGASKPSIPPYTRAHARKAWTDTNSLLANGVPPREVARRIAERHGLGKRAANRYVASALLVLQSDQDAEPIASKRARILARYERLYRAAMKRKRSVTYWVGDGVQEVEHVEDPDVKTAGQMLGAIAMIQGVVPVTMREIPQAPSPQQSRQLPAEVRATSPTQPAQPTPPRSKAADE